MKYLKLSILAAGIFVIGNSYGQSTSTTTTNPPPSQGISKSLGFYIIPNNGQDATQTQKDESDCFLWAKEQSGYDPLNPPTVTAAPVEKGPDGGAVRGAARGAAAGAAIGSISGDAGDGAAYGAIVGGLRGRRASKQQAAQQEAANQQAVEQKKKALLDDYKKAYTLCVESKGYSIK